MADGGAPSVSRRRQRLSFSDEADPRFSTQPDTTPDEARQRRKASRKQPRIAFTGEEFGFGYQAASSFIQSARPDPLNGKRGGVRDGGLWAVRGVRTEREIDPASPNDQFDFDTVVTQPLRTKEQALMAVRQGLADFAVVPFYSPYFGYDFEALRALSGMSLFGIEQIEATDKLCLAVHESQLYDLIQSAHPGSGFSALQRRIRKSWGTVDSGSGNAPGSQYDAEMPRAGLPIDMADQKLIRDRIDIVFAGPEATKRCKSKLDGLRALGVDVQQLGQTVEPHRELARLARSTVNTARQTNTFFDPVSGETRFFSTLGAEAQAGKLFGVILPYEVAMRSSDYVIIDHDLDDAPPTKTRFLVVENNPDHTLSEDAYRTTDARTRYWEKRLTGVLFGRDLFRLTFARAVGAALAAIGVALAFFGPIGASGLIEAFTAWGVSKWLDPMTALVAFAAGVILLGAGFMLMSARISGEEGDNRTKGVRVFLRFRRDGAAASIGDVENYLRNFGVRHAVVRMGEDSGADSPAPIVLDIEFDRRDFVYDPLSLGRRFRGSVVNGALKKAFARWKNRGVTVLAAAPFTEAQLPKHTPRRWWSEAPSAWLAETAETLFIRLSRVLFFYVLPAAVIFFLVWRYLIAGQ